jgi:hypothetical protein
MFSGKQKFRDENLFFSGVYQVVKVDSKMDNGQFLQTLTCVRMNNQSGEGLPVALVNAQIRGTTDLEAQSKENILSKAAKTAKDLARKEAAEFAEQFKDATP